MAVGEYLKVVANNLRRASQEAGALANSMRGQMSNTEREINDNINTLKKEILALEAALVADMKSDTTVVKDNLIRSIRNLQKQISDKQQEIKEEKTRLEQQARFLEQEIVKLNSEASEYERRAAVLI